MRHRLGVATISTLLGRLPGRHQRKGRRSSRSRSRCSVLDRGRKQRSRPRSRRDTRQSISQLATFQRPSLDKSLHRVLQGQQLNAHEFALEFLTLIQIAGDAIERIHTLLKGLQYYLPGLSSSVVLCSSQQIVTYSQKCKNNENTRELHTSACRQKRKRKQKPNPSCLHHKCVS